MNKWQKFSAKLLQWWNPLIFDYPWRRTSDPYKILISEIMLRKTTRQQVKEVYGKFFGRYNSIRSLSQANIKSIEHIIKPLGMQRTRAIALKKISKIIVSEYEGKVPKEKDLLIKLPGVGKYIANAVLCLAYENSVPLVDTNTTRVVKRVFSFRSTRKRVHDDPKLWDTISIMMPRNKAREFNLAIMDFAASVCLPKKPKCARCPIFEICDFGPEYLACADQ